LTDTKFRRAALSGASALAVALFVALPGQAQAQEVGVGYNPGENETRTVGAGQNIAASRIWVGGNGQGTLTVTDGGTVSSTDYTYIGASTSGVGTVTVAGGGSSLSVGGTLYVGYSGRGTLGVSSGATVSAANGLMLGGNGSGNGSVTVSGAGSQLHSSTYIYVGDRGLGTIGISNGGSVSSAGVIRVGNSATGIGELTVSGVGSSLSAGGVIAVGDSGRGTLTVSGGASATGNQLVIGRIARSTGTVTVTGAGSSLVTLSELNVGYAGRGSLTVADGATAKSTNESVRVGWMAGSEGALTVTGTGSSVTAYGILGVGIFGRGTVLLVDGGTVNAAGVEIGFGAGADGALTVTGAGSQLISNRQLAVGLAGSGTLDISNGAVVRSLGAALIGTETGGVGTVTVTGAGSQLTTDQNLEVGLGGTGTLTVSNGAVARSQNDTLIASAAGGVGTVTVTGAGSSLTAGGDLIIGHAGQGALTASDGGIVNVQGATRLGHTATGTGTAIVTGTGSSLTTNELSVGRLGSGALTISNGGAVRATADSGIADRAGGTGVVTVTGSGSSLTATGFFGIGDSGNGTLTVTGGGTVSVARANLGGFASGAGAVTVSGPGSSFNVTSAFSVGFAGSGTLVVSNGGSVSSQLIGVATAQNSTGTISIGGQSGSAPAAAGTISGRISFGAGDGLLAFNHNTAGYAHTGSIESLNPGNGRIRFEAGSTTFNTTGNFSGTSDVLNGAALTLNGRLGGVLNVNAGGELGGVGTIGTLNVDGVVRPGGNGTIGQLNGTSASFNAGSLYIADYTGNSADSIVLSGTANIANGSTLRVVSTPGAIYQAGSRTTVLTATGGLTGRFTLEGGARSVSAFLSLRDGYSATQAYLEVAQTRDFAAAGLTANQRAAGRGLQSVGTNSPLYNAVANMQTDASAQVAFDALSGEIHPGTRGVLARDAYRVQQIVVGNSAVVDREAAGRVWATAWAAGGHQNGDGNAARLDHDTTGILVGGDVHLGGGLRLGAAFGYDEGSVTSQRGAGHADLTRKTVVAYFDGTLGGVALRGGVGYTEAGIKTGRVVAFTSPTLNVNQTLGASYDGSVVHAYFDASYAIALGEAKVAPFASLSTASAHTKAFTEAGGNAALSVAKETTTLGYSTAGVRVNGVSLGSFDLSGSAGWRHAYGDLDAPGLHRLTGGAAFTVLGPDAGRDAAVLDLNLNWRPSDNFTIGAGVGLVSGDGSNDRNATVSLRYSF
jgi:outer membrane autotransporter protein